jgi:peptidoglycan-associated lipoprotein
MKETAMVRTPLWIATIVAAGLAGAACHSQHPAAPAPALAPTRPPAPTRSTPPPPPPVTDRFTRPSPTAAPTEEDLFRAKSLDQLNSEHPLGDAFFDYDQFSLRDDAKASLVTDAGWLKRWSGTEIRVEGHADERGTAEYNLALGQSRAKAVEDYLVSLGIPASRITVTSFGKDAPFCTGETEACWSQNRRGHMMITKK